MLTFAVPAEVRTVATCKTNVFNLLKINQGGSVIHIMKDVRFEMWINTYKRNRKRERSRLL